jgi:hypothetical protein
VTRGHNKQYCQEERRKQTRVCEFEGFLFQLYSLSLIEEYGDGLFCLNGDLSIVGCRCFIMSVDESTHNDDDSNRIKGKQMPMLLFSILLIINHGKV